MTSPVAQRSLIEMFLAPRTGDEYAPPGYALTLTKRQLAFLVDAIEHYHQDCCPLRGGTDGCRLLTCYESPTTGAIVTQCADSCTAWRDELIEQLMPAPIPSPGDGRFIPSD